ncbi:MAG: DUF4177 domain-containing protein [Gemmatirosa sp.]
MRPPRWEYKSVKIDVGTWLGPKMHPEALDAELNRFGQEGWELVSALDLNSTSGSTMAIVALFKRARD